MSQTEDLVPSISAVLKGKGKAQDVNDEVGNLHPPVKVCRAMYHTLLMLNIMYTQRVYRSSKGKAQDPEEAGSSHRSPHQVTSEEPFQQVLDLGQITIWNPNRPVWSDYLQTYIDPTRTTPFYFANEEEDYDADADRESEAEDQQAQKGKAKAKTKVIFFSITDHILITFCRALTSKSPSTGTR